MKMDLSHTIIPKSDQINADDLISGPIIIKITGVKDVGGDQPIIINYDGDNGRPYKPGKSMRRVMIAMWGTDGNKWIGQSIEIYNDPEVRFGGQDVGGIRISRATGISKTMNIMLTVTRAKRAPYTVKPLIIEEPKKLTKYPEGKFNEDLPKMMAALENGTTTVEKIVAHLEKTAPLTTAQKDTLNNSVKSNEDNEVY